jgi:hypothetical protein
MAARVPDWRALSSSGRAQHPEFWPQKTQETQKSERAIAHDIKPRMEWFAQSPNHAKELNTALSPALLPAASCGEGFSIQYPDGDQNPQGAYGRAEIFRFEDKSFGVF